MEEFSSFRSIMIFLLAGVIMVPIAQKIRLGAVLGYLLTGIVIGPFVLGFIRNVDEIMHFAELGVVFLMFLIGLGLNPVKLWTLRRSIFVVGTAQVIITAALFTGLLIIIHFSWQAALVGGLGLAMSSTAIALQIMHERNMSNTESGRLGFSVLLFQDMAVIPILAVIPFLASGTADSDWYRIGLKVVAFVGLWVGGRYLLRPLFHLVAKSGIHEIFTAASLLVVLGAAFFMEKLGFSMALGTFMAGVLLADTEFRHELEITIEPFKGLLLGLFFISVGMSLNLAILWSHLLEIVFGVVILVILKFAILYILGWLARVRRSSRLLFAGVLSQAGEFAFIIFSTAINVKVMSNEQMSLLLVIVTLSMMTTPPMMQLISKLLTHWYNVRNEPIEKPFVEDTDPQVILVGFGRVGQVVGRLLMANKIRITVLEQNVSAIYTMRRYGYKVYYGDAQDLQLLRSAGAAKASVIVITSDNPEEVMGIVHLCQANFPNLHIIARARGRFEAHQLRENGVTDFCRETFVSALEMGERTLINLGIHPHQAHRAKQHFRRLDVKIFKENSPKAGEGEIGQATRIKEARRELEELFEIEITQERGQPKSWD